MARRGPYLTASTPRSYAVTETIEVPEFIEQEDGTFVTLDQATGDSLRAEAKRQQLEGNRAAATYLRAITSQR